MRDPQTISDEERDHASTVGELTEAVERLEVVRSAAVRLADAVEDLEIVVSDADWECVRDADWECVRSVLAEFRAVSAGEGAAVSEGTDG